MIEAWTEFLWPILKGVAIAYGLVYGLYLLFRAAGLS